MNINFLPMKVKDELKRRFADKIPITVARTSGSIEGDTGEGYAIAFDDKLLFFSRKTGENEFSVRDAAGDIASAKIRREGFNIFMDTRLGGKGYNIRFSSSEQEDIAKIADKFIPAAKTGNAGAGAGAGETHPNETPRNQETPPPEDRVYSADTRIVEDHGPLRVAPAVLLAAGMMFIAKSDDNIAKEEDFYITSLLNYDKEILRKALEYFRMNDFDAFLRDSRPLDEAQRLCILANMIEIAMKDGKFTGAEQKMISRFVTELGIDNSFFDTIKEVLLIKNKTSIL